KNVVIATHGTALSTIINYYDDSFGYEDFYRIQDVMPWLVEMQFDGLNFVQWKEHELPEA
ncbi:MAG: histidine phosphatase family protein, partial [Oscillospiraceae bacterium]|nr:histidine phosphatase family protein [Oscillospiraceae bacterium]